MEEEWLIKIIIISWYMLTSFTRRIHALFSTNAIGHLDIITRSPGISICSPNIWVVTEKCNFQQITEFQVNYVSFISSGKASVSLLRDSVGPLPYLQNTLHVNLLVDLSPQNGSILRKVMDLIHLFYSQIFVRWMNGWMNERSAHCAHRQLWI